MPNSNYVRGRNFEYTVVNDYREAGYEAFRTAGSHGKFDVIAIHPETGCVELIQCKLVDDEATKDRLQKKFRENPPFKPARLPPGVHQWLAVKVKGKKSWKGIVV